MKGVESCVICKEINRRGLDLYRRRFGLSYIWFKDEEFEDARIVHDGDCFIKAEEIWAPDGFGVKSRNVQGWPHAENDLDNIMEGEEMMPTEDGNKEA
jgi:hypothetical protein